MKFNYKNLLVPAILTILSGCDSSDSGNSSIQKGANSAPVLDTTVLESAYGNYATVYTGVGSADDGSESLQWDFTFTESDGNWDDPNSDRKVDYLDINLLTGITDPDFGDALIVKDVIFTWRGPDCSQTTSTALDYPDLCNPILEELGLMQDDGEGGRIPINTNFDQEEDIRELQNLPIVSTPLYGFDLKQDYLRVTPSMFAPILVTGQTAQLGIIYKVTDGEETIERRLKVVIQGEDKAPEFIQIDKYGEPITDQATGEYLPVDVTSASASEKDKVTIINLIEGIFDQDVYDAANLINEVGDLTKIYNIAPRNDYSIETMRVHSFTPPEGILDGAYDIIEESKEGVGVVSYNLVLDPSVYADQLAKGETEVLSFSYIVSDGTNDVARTFDFTIKGANEFNEPSFDEPVITKVVYTNENPQLVDLLEGVSDPEGDTMTLVDLVASTPEEYGLVTTDLVDTGKIVLDPYFFTYLAPGEVKDFTYTYKVSDGSLISEERTFTISITGANTNIANRGENSDPSFEKPIAEGPYSWQWSPSGASMLTIDAVAAHTGASGANNLEDNVFMRVNKPAFQQGIILEGDSFYLNFFAKQENAGSSINAIINEEGVWNNTAFEEATGNLGSTDWVEHTATVVDASDFFTENATFDVTLHGHKGFIDDFSLVKYQYALTRELSPESTFTLGSAGGWKVSGDATLEVLEEANRYANTDDTQYGLKVTGGAAATELYFDSSVFPKGAVKKGMRYIVEFDLKDEGFVSPNPAALNVMFKEEGGTNVSRRLAYAKQTTAWSHYALHINTASDGNDLNGPVNSDVDFDWESVDVTFALQIPAGKTFHIDNIRIFPVPQ